MKGGWEVDNDEFDQGDEADPLRYRYLGSARIQFAGAQRRG